jgi:cytochrome P450/NADPH-cytochrome P450 reductase
MQAAVLGVGDSAWHLTYQAVPTEMDTLLRQSLGLSPQADGERVLSQSTMSVSRADHASLDMIDEGVSNGYVASIRELRRTSEDATAGRSIRHVEITLPEGMSYETGDHLIVHSYNNRLVVDRALDVLGIEAGAMIDITAEDSAGTWLPTGHCRPRNSMLRPSIGA